MGNGVFQSHRAEAQRVRPELTSRIHRLKQLQHDLELAHIHHRRPTPRETSWRRLELSAALNCQYKKCARRSGAAGSAWPRLPFWLGRVAHKARVRPSGKRGLRNRPWGSRRWLLSLHIPLLVIMMTRARLLVALLLGSAASAENACPGILLSGQTDGPMAHRMGFYKHQVGQSTRSVIVSHTRCRRRFSTTSRRT